MRSSSSVPATPDNDFSPRGHDALVRDVEELNLQLADLGIEAEGLSRALVAQQVTTNDAINNAVVAHEAKSNPHPQYALLASLPTPFSALYVTAEGSGSPQNISGLTAITTAMSAGSGTLTGLSSGVFTAPATGFYLFSISVGLALITAGAGTAQMTLYSTGNGASERIFYAPAGTNITSTMGVSEGRFMTSGQTHSYFAYADNSGGVSGTATVFVRAYSAVRIV